MATVCNVGAGGAPTGRTATIGIVLRAAVCLSSWARHAAILRLALVAVWVGAAAVAWAASLLVLELDIVPIDTPLPEIGGTPAPEVLNVERVAARPIGLAASAVRVTAATGRTGLCAVATVC